MAPKSVNLELFRGKIQDFPAIFGNLCQNLQKASSPQLQNSHTQKSFISEVDNFV